MFGHFNIRGGMACALKKVFNLTASTSDTLRRAIDHGLRRVDAARTAQGTIILSLASRMVGVRVGVFPRSCAAMDELIPIIDMPLQDNEVFSLGEF